MSFISTAEHTIRRIARQFVQIRFAPLAGLANWATSSARKTPPPTGSGTVMGAKQKQLRRYLHNHDEPGRDRNADGRFPIQRRVYRLERSLQRNQPDVLACGGRPDERDRQFCHHLHSVDRAQRLGHGNCTPAGTDRAINCGSNCSAKFMQGTTVTLSRAGPDLRELDQRLRELDSDLRHRDEQRHVRAGELQVEALENNRP